MKELTRALLIFVVLFLSISTTSVLGYDLIDLCMNVSNITPVENIVFVNVAISSGENGADYVVGDYQTYSLVLRNIGTNTLNTTFTVKVYDPTNNSIGNTRIFSAILLPDENETFIPNKTAKINGTATLVDVYPFDNVGNYKIVVDSDDPKIYFYRFFPRYAPPEFHCPFMYQESFTQYYDVISTSDKQWRDTLRNWQNEAQILNNKNEELNVENQAINRKMLDINNRVLLLTIISLIVFLRDFYMKSNMGRLQFILWLLLVFVFAIFILLSF